MKKSTTCSGAFSVFPYNNKIYISLVEKSLDPIIRGVIEFLYLLLEGSFFARFFKCLPERNLCVNRPRNRVNRGLERGRQKPFALLGQKTNSMIHKWRCRHESTCDIGLLRMRSAQLQHHQEQEEHTRQAGDEQVLQILQEAYAPQRDKVRKASCNGEE